MHRRPYFLLLLRLSLQTLSLGLTPSLLRDTMRSDSCVIYSVSHRLLLSAAVFVLEHK